eukprot:g7287.t1
METFRGVRGRRRRRRRRRHNALLLAAVLASSASGPRTQSRAQQAPAAPACGSATPLRVENLAGATALNTAVNCADGGEVEAIWAGVVALDAPISIGSGTFLSVTGEDALAEAAGGAQVRLFTVSSAGGLSLTNLRLSGGAAVSGGAVHATSATVTLDGCVFEGNGATAGDGGAVWAEGGELTITGGEFLGNTAVGNGGAVVAVDGAVVIQDGTLFEENWSMLEGGGLYCGGVENSTSGVAASCSLSEAVFRFNNASSEVVIDYDVIEAPWVNMYGGGGAAFYRGSVGMTDSVFEFNYAQLSGGGVYGGSDSDMVIDGCRFEENATPGWGGAMAASSATLGGGTLVKNNSAEEHGAGVFGWDESGAIELNDFLCTDNTAVGHGGCFYVSGGGVVNDGTVMTNNEGKYGGCVYAYGGSDLDIFGGDFAVCLATANGAFMFASDGAVVNMKNASVTDSIATRRGGVVYCSGDSFDLGGSKVTIEGGTFRNNQALELGGAIVAWGTPTVVTITGGLFSNNTSKFYGGFIFLEEEASLSCEGATISDHYAGDQGGAIYGRDATWINSTCDLIGNGAPQGAAVYLTHTVQAAQFSNHEVTDNVASGGSVLYATASSIVASGVNFQSGVGLQEDSTNRAIQLEVGATLVADGCVFGGWMGDSVVYNANPAAGSLVLDRCDFVESTAVMMVASPHSDAEIRNAYVGRHTVDNAVMLNGSSPVLVDRALGCEDPGACGAAGECVDSDLGVLCECLEGDRECLDGGGALSIGVEKEPPPVTYYPDPVYFELVVAAAADGTTPVIWSLIFEADDLDLQLFPSSGVLPPGQNTTVTVTGTQLQQDVGGDLLSRFVATSVGSSGGDSGEGSTTSRAATEVEVTSAFYLCREFEYAVPVGNTTEVVCEQCVTITGAEGVDCERPGATLASLPVREGYWRSSREAQVVHQCIHPESCGGATQMTTSDDYCRAGYEGPYCASCRPGYGKSIGSRCHSCEDEASRWLIAAGAFLTLLALLFLVVAVVFLIGGLDAVEEVRRSVTKTLSVSANKDKAPTFWKPARESTVPHRRPSVSSSASGGGGGGDNPTGIATVFAPAFAQGSPSLPVHALEEEGEAKEGFRDEPRRNCRVAPVDSSEQGSIAAAAATTATTATTRSSETVVGGHSVPGGFVNSRLLAQRTTASYGDRSVAQPAVAGAAGGGTAVAIPGEKKEEEGGDSAAACCGLGEKIKRWASRVPLDKLKILVVVWQILTVFPSITGADFPASYARFLSWIDVVNLDVGSIFSGTCVLPDVNFYQRLLLTTLAPLGLAVVLMLTFSMAKRRAGIGSASVIARRAAWSRHMAAGLLLTFLVFTSTSTVVFKTFACDGEAVEGESFLRADYSLSCNTTRHTWYKVYAGIMIVVYPIGIPLLYAYILWINRESLNPCAQADDASRSTMAMMRSDYTLKETQAELEERIEKRRQNPDLVPSMFLWKDFGPDMYYYEVIECGRRILLTGALIFIAPHTAAQAAMACIFAFASLLGFELLRPHLDAADSWLYRLGCVVIFLSNFVALLIKVDAAGEENRAVLGGIMVAVNALLILAVLSASWFATQQMVDDQRNGESTLAVARTMLTHEQMVADSKRSERAESVHRAETAKAAAAAAGAAAGGVSRTSSSSMGAQLLRATGSVGARLPFRGGGGGATGGGSVSRGPVPGRGGSVSAAMVEELWKEDKAMGSSAH